MTKTIMIILGIVISIIVLIGGLFIWFIAYSSTTDLSEDIRFKKYLNEPLVVKQTSALIKGSSGMFSHYSIDVSSKESFKSDKRILVKYNIGDTITFTGAKKVFSNHVGDSYYLLGQEKLDSGEIIEFEYGASFKYLPAIWETLEAFLLRIKKGEDFP